MPSAKFFGYLMAIIGLVGLVFANKKVLATVPFLAGMPVMYILVPSVILVGVGIILVTSQSGGNKSELGQEVPILKGKKIVGYRVLK